MTNKPVTKSERLDNLLRAIGIDPREAYKEVTSTLSVVADAEPIEDPPEEEADVVAPLDESSDDPGFVEALTDNVCHLGPAKIAEPTVRDQIRDQLTRFRGIARTILSQARKGLRKTPVTPVQVERESLVMYFENIDKAFGQLVEQQKAHSQILIELAQFVDDAAIERRALLSIVWSLLQSVNVVALDQEWTLDTLADFVIESKDAQDLLEKFDHRYPTTRLLSRAAKDHHRDLPASIETVEESADQDPVDSDDEQQSP